MNLKGIHINSRNWVDSAQVRDCWRAILNAALKFRVLKEIALDTRNWINFVQDWEFRRALVNATLNIRVP